MPSSLLYRLPLLLAGVRFLIILQTANTKTIKLGLFQVKIMIFPLLFAVSIIRGTENRGKQRMASPRITRAACMRFWLSFKLRTKFVIRVIRLFFKTEKIIKVSGQPSSSSTILIFEVYFCFVKQYSTENRKY